MERKIELPFAAGAMAYGPATDHSTSMEGVFLTIEEVDRCCAGGGGGKCKAIHCFPVRVLNSDCPTKGKFVQGMSDADLEAAGISKGDNTPLKVDQQWVMDRF